MGGGGTTSTTGTIAPELRGLFMGSANSLLDQQHDNPLGQYNEANPLDVAGANPWQQMGLGMIAGGGQPTGLDGLSLQSILRMPGLAGAGPTTGQYDYGSEAGLSDIMGFMNPQYGVGGGVNQYASRPAGEGYLNSDPTGNDPSLQGFGGLGQALAPPPGPKGPAPYGGMFGLPTGNGGVGGSPSFAGYGGSGGPGMSQNNPVGAGQAPGGAPSGGSDFMSRAMQQIAENKFGGEQGKGWGMSLSDLNDSMADKGITASGGGVGGLQLSGGGKTYLNQGGSHEGAGPGGQSKFLSDVLGSGGGERGNYGANAALDQNIAGVAQRMRYADTRGMDPNSSVQDVVAANAAKNAAAQASPAGQARAAKYAQDPKAVAEAQKRSQAGR